MGPECDCVAKVRGAAARETGVGAIPLGSLCCMHGTTEISRAEWARAQLAYQGIRLRQPGVWTVLRWSKE